MALGVGAKDVGEVGLNHAFVGGNNWQYEDHQDDTWTDNTSGDIGACSAIKVTVKGKYLEGDHKGDGYMSFNVSCRASFGSWHSESGKCLATSSSAKGKKWYVSLATRIDPRKPNCYPNGPCKKCTTTTAAE